MIKQQLADTDHTVRSKCLELLGALGRPDSEGASEDEKSPKDILDEYSRDTDPRVRTAAFKALVNMIYIFLAHLTFTQMMLLPRDCRI